MGDMSATVEEIACSAEEVSATDTSAVDRGQEGREYAAEAPDEIEVIEPRPKTFPNRSTSSTFKWSRSARSSI